MTAAFLTDAPGRNALADVVVAKAKTIKDWMRNMVDDGRFYAAGVNAWRSRGCGAAESSALGESKCDLTPRTY